MHLLFQDMREPEIRRIALRVQSSLLYAVLMKVLCSRLLWPHLWGPWEQSELP
jgi:hypothetical protein